MRFAMGVIVREFITENEVKELLTELIDDLVPHASETDRAIDALAQGGLLQTMDPGSLIGPWKANSSAFKIERGVE